MGIVHDNKGMEASDFILSGQRISHLFTNELGDRVLRPSFSPYSVERCVLIEKRHHSAFTCRRTLRATVQEVDRQ